MNLPEEDTEMRANELRYSGGRFHSIQICQLHE